MCACVCFLLESFPAGDLPDEMQGPKFKSLMSPALAGSFLTTSITSLYVCIYVYIKVALSNGEEFFFSEKVFQ